MKNKKIVVCLVIAVMVLGFTLTALVGCKDWKYIEPEDMMEFLISAAENTAEGNNLNSLQIGADITVEAQYGASNKTYNIAIAGDLGLDTSKDKKNKGSFVVTDGDGKNVISAFYNESATSYADSVFLQIGENGKFILPAVLVKQILSDNGATVTDDQSTQITNKIINGLDGATNIFTMIGFGEDGMNILNTQVAKNGLTYRFSVNLGDILSGDTIAGLLKEMGNGIQDMIKELGIDLDLNALDQVLPALEVVINVNVTSKNKEDAKIASIDASLYCPKADVVIKKTGDNAGNLLTLKLDNDVNATVKLDLTLGQDKVKSYSGDWSNAVTLGGAINLEASGTFELKNDIQTSIANILNINIPADTYKLKLGVEMDPAAIAKMASDFKNIHSTQHAIDVALKAIDAGVKYLNIEITTEEGEDFLQFAFATKNGRLTATSIKVDALGITSDTIKRMLTSLSTATVMDLIGTIEGIANTTIIKDTLDYGYAFANGEDYSEGYTADTANGFVNNDAGNGPKIDSYGFFVADKANGYVTVLNTVTKQEVSVADYNAQVAEITDEKEKAAFEANFNNLYTKDADRNVYVAKGYVYKDGAYVVDTANGYVDKYNNETGKSGADGIPDRENGAYKCATGYKIYKGFPMKNAEADEKLKADEEAAKNDDSFSFSTADLIKGLIVVIDKGISVTLGNIAVTEDISLAATLGIDASNIIVDATVNGLDEGVNGVELPGELGVKITINFSDFHYGTANR